MITHANLHGNDELIKKSFMHDDRCDLVGWLPIYHDMGLIGNILQPLYIGATAYLMSPMAFLEKPARWLKAISRYRAHTSGGPKFAYDLCSRKVTDDEKRELDLSCWQIAFQRGRARSRIDARSIFGRFFGCRLCKKPASSLAMVWPRRRSLSPRRTVATALLYRALIVRRSNPARSCRAAATSLSISLRADMSGRGTHVEIVHPETFARCPKNEIGEIWVRGPGVAKGYWQRSEETARTFEASIAGEEGRHYLRTGELGFSIVERVTSRAD